MQSLPSSLNLLRLGAVLTLLVISGCGENKASRFYEDPDPITAPSSTPPIQAAVDAQDAPPFQVANDEADEGKKPEEEEATDSADASEDPSEDSAENTSENASEDASREKPRKPRSAEADEEAPAESEPAPVRRKPQPIPSPGSSVPAPVQSAPKRTLPKNSNVITPGESAPTNQPSRLQIKQNLDDTQTKPAPTKPMGTIQPEPKPQPKAPAQKPAGNVIAPVDLAPMNAPDDDLPPPPKNTGE